MKIYLAGHRGMVGAAVHRALVARGADDVVTRDRAALDLTDPAAVQDFLHAERPDAVILAAAKVGGIQANTTQPAAFIHDNLMIASNVIHGAHLADVQTLLQLGSSCIYPRAAPQPIPEEALLTGPLEPTNEPYAVAKIAAIKLCESYNRQHGRDYRSVMPTNLYGPGDNFHPEHSHVLPALIRRFHGAHAANAESVVIWGTGSPMREFMHVSDLAEACIFAMNLPQAHYKSETTPMRSHLNVGSGHEILIADLAALVARVVGYEGRLEFDQTKPDGTPRKLLDTTRLTRLGWTAKTRLEDGVRETYRWYLEAVAQGGQQALRGADTLTN